MTQPHDAGDSGHGLEGMFAGRRRKNVQSQELLQTFKDITRVSQTPGEIRVISVGDSCKAAKNLMEDLNIPSMEIDVRDIMMAGGPDDLKESPNLSWSHIQQYLKGLLMLNFNTRDNDLPALTQTSKEVSADDAAVDSDDSEDDDQSRPNPMEYFLLVYQICNMTLKQAIARSLFMCRLAIPLVIPNFKMKTYEISLMPLMNISLSWTSRDGNSKESPALNAPSHFVSFVRLGDLIDQSKSKILNTFLDDSGHPTFVHWDCKNGSNSRCISDGMVELSWYLPRKNSDPHDILSVFNLRGDAIHFPNQFSLLVQISQSFVCFIHQNNMKNASILETLKKIHDDVPITLVIRGSTTNIKRDDIKYLQASLGREKDSLSIFKFTQNINMTTCVDRLHTSIAKHLEMKMEDKSELIRLENLQSWTCDTRQYRYQIYLADCVIKNVSEVPPRRVKSVVFQLQGDPWQKMTQNEKTLARDLAQEQKKQNKRAGEVRKSLKDSISNYKQAQQICLTNLDKTILNGVSILRHGQFHREQLLQFWNMLGNLLNMHCQANLPGLYSKYKNILAEKRHSSMSVVEPAISLSQVEKNIHEASIGLEHMFREFAHIYQADRMGSKPHFSDLPQIVASSIIAGLPLELLDGDVGNIPMEWIQAVLTEIRSIVGNGSILVLSVVGIQSSGKSTLLNAMFGLRFAVSAGRCTKGIYMQLVEASNLPFEYILVLDSEGLRSQEIGQMTAKDNELATFLLAIADVIIVNVKGENYAEMKDVLQIAVHAFLRMHLVHERLNDSKRCIFIHQNTPAADAKAKNAVGYNALQDALDLMTKEAAGQEGLNHIQSFNQVMKFECDKDVWFFPDLWNGTPPMCFISPEYTKSVLDVRQMILQAFTLKHPTSFRTLEGFQMYVKDVWACVLKENFVFAFKNSLEARSFQSLESIYQACLKKFQSQYDTWESANTPNLINIEEEVFPQTKERILYKLQKDLSEMQTQLLKEFSDYFEENPDSRLLWHESKIAALGDEMKAMSEKFKRLLTSKIDRCLLVFQTNSYEVDFKRKLFDKALEVAKAKKSALKDECQMSRVFDEIWSSTSEELALFKKSKELNPVEELQSDMSKALVSEYFTHSSDVDRSFQQVFSRVGGDSDFVYMPIKQADIKDFHLNLTTNERPPRVCGSSYEIWDLATKTVADYVNEFVMTHVDDVIQQISKTVHYSPALIHSIIERVKNRLNDSLALHDYLIVMRPSLHIHVAVMALKKSMSVLSQVYKNTLEINSFEKEISDYRHRLWTFFSNSVQDKTVEQNLSLFLENMLERLIRDYVRDKSPSVFQNELGKVFCTKSDLLCAMLESLAEKKDFESYEKYFDNPQEFAAHWLSMYCAENVKLNVFYDNLLVDIKGKFFMCLNVTAEKFKGKVNIKAKDWVKRFLEVTCDLFMVGFVVSLTDSKALSEALYISSTEVIWQEFNESIKALSDKVIDEFKCLGDIDKICPRMIFSNIVENMWGCPALCPFCNEPCCHASTNHFQTDGIKHLCLQHRPQATRGWFDDKKKKLNIYNCNYYVATKKETYKVKGAKRHKWRSYQKYYQDWDIESSKTMENSEYWQWFMANLGQELAERQQADLPEIYQRWKDISFNQAILSLMPSQTKRL